jgi:hypothetical protein
VVALGGARQRTSPNDAPGSDAWRSPGQTKTTSRT